jgi:Cdc6-like AAA superfamily ATPase
MMGASLAGALRGWRGAKIAGAFRDCTRSEALANGDARRLFGILDHAGRNKREMLGL